MPAANEPAYSPTDQPTIGMTPIASSNQPVAGEQFGDFVLLNEIGRGGMGVVYKAFEPQLGRYVAVKMILSGALTDREDLNRFHVEASAAARLQHSHIVKVHRVGTCEDRHYYSMDFIDGQSLTQRLADGPVPSRIAARYLLTVARAIHHAHEHGILHRDIKPGNILVDTSDEPHVTDFGLAKHLSGDRGQTRTGALMGTPSYMAPEQARGEKDLSPATDVYGLGALLYELLTARPPFRGETAIETLQQVLHNEPAPPRLLNPHAARDLETICLKCLANSPRDRYPTAAALADDLSRYLEGAPIQARSLNMIDYLQRALERSQFDVEFRSYGNLMFTFAIIVAITHALKFVLMLTGQPYATIVTARIAQFLLLFAALLLKRPIGRGFLPASAAERLLWSVWIGFIAACFLASGITHRLAGMDAMYRGDYYPIYALFSGMALIVLGSSYWGWLYAFGTAFFALALVMTIDLRLAVLEFGALWTVTLCSIGVRLRRLGREREQSAPTVDSSGKENTAPPTEAWS
jgi:hypothetical protein